MESGRFYTKDHEWISRDPAGPDCALVGVSAYAAGEMGDIVFVDFPAVGRAFGQGESFGVLESPKAASDLYMPLAGEILEVNSLLDDEPERINADPLGEWIVRLRGVDWSGTGSLMDEEAYSALVAALTAEKDG